MRPLIDTKAAELAARGPDELDRMLEAGARFLAGLRSDDRPLLVIAQPSILDAAPL